MISRWIRWALLVIVVTLVVVQATGRGPFGNLLPPLPGVGCVLDPAKLPPPPPGPDGRPANYLHTCGNRLFDQHGREVRITGLNWSGMETPSYAPLGLQARNWQDILDQIAALGYNTVRLPFSDEALEPDRRVAWVDFGLNPDLEGLSGLQMLDRLVEAARERGLKIILDRHYVAAQRPTNLWYTADVPEQRWIADWRMLAARYRGNDTVVAVDLHNEPHGEATWGSGDPNTDWRLAAERAGNAVLEANPYLLVFVEGTENYGNDHWWWGGNLEGVQTAPVRLRVPNRLVYSPHDYGPAVTPQPWFWDPRFPSNLPGQWDRHWGYIFKQGIAPVVVGEFGGRSLGDDRDGQWQRTLLTYLRTYKLGALVWSLNPSWDTGGILANDWRTVVQDKQTAYQQLLAPPIDQGLLGVFGQAPPHYKVLFRQGDAEEQTDSVTFSLRILNDSRNPMELSRFEARYWLRAEESPSDQQRIQVEASDALAGHVLVNLVPAEAGDQDHYLRVRFDARAGALARYGASGNVTVRYNGPARKGRVQARDYSYAAAPDLHQGFGEWDRVTLYLDGQLVWGREP